MRVGNVYGGNARLGVEGERGGEAQHAMRSDGTCGMMRAHQQPWHGDKTSEGCKLNKTTYREATRVRQRG